MKLLELIVKNIKREKIDPVANFFAQDWGTRTNRILGYSHIPKADAVEWNSKFYIPGSSLNIPIVAEDAETTIITREELMKAYDLVEQGYTLWFGGDCPVDEEVRVDIFCINGKYGEGICASSIPWGGDTVKGYKVSKSQPPKSELKKEVKVRDNSNFIDIVSIITFVMPGVLAVDAIEIANSLIDDGYHK